MPNSIFKQVASADIDSKSPLPIFLFLLVPMPLMSSALLSWQEYFRLGVIAIALGAYVWRQYRLSESERSRSNLVVLLTLGLSFILTQFDPITLAHAEMVSGVYLNVFFVVSSLMVMAAFAAFLLSPVRCGKLSLVDRAIVGTLVFAIGLSCGSSLLFGGSFAWYNVIKYVLYGMLWFTITRWVSMAPKLERSLV